MPNLRIIADNLSDSATLSVSPAVVATLPVTNLQLSLRAKVMRTTSTADQQIKGTWTAAQVLSGACLWRHNLTSAATWKLELFSDAAWTTKVYDSGDVLANPGKALGDLIWGVDPLGVNVFTGWGKAFSVMWFASIVAQSWRITIMDSANPAGYLEIGRLFLGLALEPTYNMSYGVALEWVDDSTQSRTDGGSLRSDAAEVYRRLTIRLDWLTDSDRPKWLDITRTAGKRKDVFLSGYPTSGGQLERDHACAGKLTAGAPVKHPQYGTHSIELTLEET